MATNAPAGAAALAAWAVHLESERHASPHTLRAYLADVRELLAVAGGDPRAVRAETIRHWLRTLDGRLARTSIARKLAAVRAFFRFLVRTGHLAADPAAGVGTPKTRRRPPRLGGPSRPAPSSAISAAGGSPRAASPASSSATWPRARSSPGRRRTRSAT